MTGKGVWKGLLVGLSILLLSVLAFGQTQGLIDDSVLTKVLDSGVLKVGTNLGYVPYEMMDEHGNAIGFDIDLARLVAEELDVELQLVIVDWQGLLAGLTVGKYDLVICGLGRTLERAKKLAFTKPYDSIGQSALISNRLPGITNLEELNSPTSKPFHTPLPVIQIPPYDLSASPGCRLTCLGDSYFDLLCHLLGGLLLT